MLLFLICTSLYFDKIHILILLIRPYSTLMSQTMAELFSRITTGVYVVGVAGQERQNAFTATWVMPVSFQPLLLALSINPNHLSYQLLREGRVFSVNVLRKDQLDLAAHFGRPAQSDKFAGMIRRFGKTGAPLLADVLAHFECTLTGEYPAGDHVLVLGRVVEGFLEQPGAEPLIYRDTGNMDGSSLIFPDDF